MKLRGRAVILAFVLTLAVVSTFTLTAASGSFIQQFPTTYSSTSSSSTTTTTVATTTSTTTSFSTSSTTTQTTSTSTSWSYTSSTSVTTTNSSTQTSYTATFYSTTTSTSTTTSFATFLSFSTVTAASTTTKPPSFPGCAVSAVTTGTILGPFADFMRRFRNAQVLGTQSGREFLLLFNAWYYGWAPGVARAAVLNGWAADALRVFLLPTFGALVASYATYGLLSPFGAEAGVVGAGLVGAFLLGAVYLGPFTYLFGRAARMNRRLLARSRAGAFSAGVCLAGSLAVLGGALVFSASLLVGPAAACVALSTMMLGAVWSFRLIAAARPVWRGGFTPWMLLVARRARNGFP